MQKYSVNLAGASRRKISRRWTEITPMWNTSREGSYSVLKIPGRKPPFEKARRPTGGDEKFKVVRDPADVERAITATRR
mgnify:CR=1 FL=1